MAITGKGGSIKVGAVVISQMQSWKLDINIDTKDFTHFQSNGWSEKISGIKSWSGSSDGSWNLVTDTTGQKAVQDALLSGTAVTIEFNLDGTKKYSGSAFIKKVAVDEPVDDIVKFSIDIEGTGALTYV